MSVSLVNITQNLIFFIYILVVRFITLADFFFNLKFNIVLVQLRILTPPFIGFWRIIQRGLTTFELHIHFEFQ